VTNADGQSLGRTSTLMREVAASMVGRSVVASPPASEPHDI